MSNASVYFRSGFTLVELVVVIAVVAILAALLMTSLSRAKEKACLTACRNNMRQLGIAMMLYLGDHNDTFPTAQSANTLIPSDWIHWDDGSSGGGSLKARDIRNSAIAPYIGNFNTNLFRCPSDRMLRKLDPDSRDSATKAKYRWQLYRFSYTLNSSALHQVNRKVVQHGMASIYSPPSPYMPFRGSRIRNPSEKIMLAEERMLYESQMTILDEVSTFSSAWDWTRDQLTVRHDKKGNVVLADGHVETVKPEFGQEKEHYDPLE